MAHLYNIHVEAVAITDLRSPAYRTSIEFPPNYFQAGACKILGSKFEARSEASVGCRPWR